MLENILLTVLIREAVDVVKKIINKWFGRRNEKRENRLQVEKEIGKPGDKPGDTSPAEDKKKERAAPGDSADAVWSPFTGGAAVEGSDCRIIETVFDLSSSSLLTTELLEALQWMILIRCRLLVDRCHINSAMFRLTFTGHRVSLIKQIEILLSCCGNWERMFN